MKMQPFHSFSLILSMAFLLVSCGSSTDKKVKTDSIQDNNQVIAKATQIDPSGNYVSAHYEQRNKGYDWVGVNIEQVNELHIRIKVRSRSDLKKPSCTLDAIASRMAAGIYKAELTGGVVLFEFKDGNLNIKSIDGKDVAALYFYCSGGASLAGSYNKITAALDTAQLNNAKKITIN